MDKKSKMCVLINKVQGALIINFKLFINWAKMEHKEEEKTIERLEQNKPDI